MALKFNVFTGTFDIDVSGVISLANVGSTPNDQGGSVSGSVLTLQPADGTHPGLIDTNTQTFAGDKTFTGYVTVGGNITGLNLNTDNQVNASNLRGNNLDSPAGNPTLMIGGTNATSVDFSGIDVNNVGTFSANGNVTGLNLNTANQVNCSNLRANNIDSPSAGGGIFLGGTNASVIDVSGLVIRNAADPNNPQDLATRAFVLANAGGLPSPLEAVASQSTNAGGTGPFVGVDSDPNQSTSVVLLGSTDTSTANNKTTSVFILSGDVLSGSGNAGSVNIQGGQSQTGNPGGIVLAAGAGNATNGGGINLFAGDGSASSGTGDGGNVQIFAGGSDTAGNGGDVILFAGQNFGAGHAGTVRVDGAFAMDPAPQTVTAGATITSHKGSSANIDAAGPVSTSTTTVIEAGIVNGQILILVNTGSFTITLKSGGNTDLPGLIDYPLTASSTISFIWMGSTWYCTGASVN